MFRDSQQKNYLFIKHLLSLNWHGIALDHMQLKHQKWRMGFQSQSLSLAMPPEHSFTQKNTPQQPPKGQNSLYNYNTIQRTIIAKGAILA